MKDIAINVAKELQRAETDPPTDPEVKITSVRKNSLVFTFPLPLPMSADPAWTPHACDVEKVDEKVNRYSLKIEGLRGFLAIRVGDLKNRGRRVPMRGDKLEKGIDLAELLKLQPEPKTAEVWKLIDQKNRILGPAWLTHVGHKRPDTPKGMPFEEARLKAAALDEAIRKLCQPTEVSLGVGPFGK